MIRLHNDARNTILCAIVGWLFVFNAFSHHAEFTHPNIILIVADDLGYGALGSYGNTQNETPHLDKMANDGIKFTDFHSNGAVCSPTRAAMMTGLYQQRVGVPGVVTAASHRDTGMDLSAQTMADLLKAAGYKTALFGKWHLGYAPRFNPANRGFDEFVGFVAGNLDFHRDIDQEGYYDWWVNTTLTRGAAGYLTDKITDGAVDYIERNKEHPFFMYVAHGAPHSPYQGREDAGYRIEGGGRQASVPGQSSGEAIAAYREMMKALDEGVGSILTTLKEQKLDSNTLVIFISDNGANGKTNDNTPLKGHKGSVWEGGHRVPAIFHWPGVITPSVNDEMIVTMDLLPTFMNLAGKKVTHSDGIDVTGVLVAQDTLVERTVVWAVNNNKFAVRKGDWKYVKSSSSNTHLYNLSSDIEESNNVKNQNTAIVQELSSYHSTWSQDVKNLPMLVVEDIEGKVDPSSLKTSKNIVAKKVVVYDLMGNVLSVSNIDDASSLLLGYETGVYVFQEYSESGKLLNRYMKSAM